MNHRWLKFLSVPLLVAALVACPTEVVVSAKVTGIDATANPATVASGATSSLTATVSGTGTFNAGVNWNIVSGGGNLSASTGSSITYTAPSVTVSTSVQIKATAAGDSSISKTLQVGVNPSTGTLALSITGPTGVSTFAPNVSVSGVSALITSLGGLNLTLPVGNVTVTANAVTVTGTVVDSQFPGYIDVPSKPSSSTVSIAPGASSSVNVRYDSAGFTGKLWKIENSNQFYGFGDGVLTGPSGNITPTATGGAGALFHDMAFDKDGNLWIPNGNNVVQEYSPSFSLIQTITSNANSLLNPTGIAFDASGNLWVANFAGHTIVKYNKSSIDGKSGENSIPVDTIINTVPSAFFYQIAFDKSGNLWAIDYQETVKSKLYKFNAADLNSNPPPSVTAQLLDNKVYGISIDDAGMFWISTENAVYKYRLPTENITPTPFARLQIPSNFKNAAGTAFDKAGNLWVGDDKGIYQFTVAQLGALQPGMNTEPAKTFNVVNLVQSIRFYPIPTNSALYH